jgi:hypothetical protein
MSTLAVSVAQYNDCQAKYENAEFGQNYGKKRVMFLGYKNDVDLAIAMFDRLLKIIDKLSREYVRGLKDAPADPMRLIINFKYGAAIEINSRLVTMTAERDALIYSGGTSLVISKKKDVEAEFGKVSYGKSRGIAVSGNAEREARRFGHVKGASVEITPNIR